MYLKDVTANQLLEHGPEYEGEYEDEGVKVVKSYYDEQEEIRRAFLEAAEEEDGEGELLNEKGGNESEEDDENVIKDKLDEYFGEDEELDEDSKFLKGYFLNKMWVDKDEDKKKKVEQVLEELSDEEEEIEREISFRHEEGVGDRVESFPRKVEGSVRKKTSSRKLQRQSKEERKAIAELERREEVKHLKNLKKMEYEEKIKKVREVGGVDESIVACALEEDDFEEEFDPEEHDRKMKAMFGDEYYGAEDVDPDFCSDREEDEGDLGKPDFDKEDELLGLPKDWDVPNAENDNEEEEEAPEEGKGKRKHKLTLQEKVAMTDDLEKKYGQELEDELHKLDYEDTIGDLKTRFKYAKVKPKRYGLSMEELLMMDDKDLNQYVSLKKIAPYREKEWKVPNIKRYEQKMKNKELLNGGKLDGQKTGKQKSRKEDGQSSVSVRDMTNDGKTKLEESKSDEAKQGKKRRREAKLKLLPGRQFGYGKISSLPKHKAKN